MPFEFAETDAIYELPVLLRMVEPAASGDDPLVHAGDGRFHACWINHHADCLGSKRAGNHILLTCACACHQMLRDT